LVDLLDGQVHWHFVGLGAVAFSVCELKILDIEWISTASDWNLFIKLR
jgi:hypothetical protein